MGGRRFVFDTNTIVSAFLFENGKPGRALDLAEEQGRLFVSAETARELSETLEYERFDDYVDRETRHELLLALPEEAKLAEVTEQIQESRDPLHEVDQPSFNQNPYAIRNTPPFPLP
ncbi:MAG: putative toxin-antitoxin system toxin component, PIN family [Bacteroidetes bacterium QS_7_67_15]|nr:MAG: putative toxin-antitoxin system toxin component, PIN family [Bacteroidetes bacterium QS_7_67_15]